MAGTPTNPAEKTEASIPQNTAEHVAAKGAEQTITRELFKTDSDKQSKGGDNLDKGDPAERTLSERVCDEAYALWKSASQLTGTEKKSSEQNGAGNSPGQESNFIVMSSPFKPTDAGAALNQAGDGNASDAGDNQPENRGWFQRAKDWTK